MARESSFVLSPMSRHSTTIVCELGSGFSSDIGFAGIWILDFPALEPWEIHLSVNHLVSGISSQQPEQTQTTAHRREFLMASWWLQKNSEFNTINQALHDLSLDFLRASLSNICLLSHSQLLRTSHISRSMYFSNLSSVPVLSLPGMSLSWLGKLLLVLKDMWLYFFSLLRSPES